MRSSFALVAVAIALVVAESSFAYPRPWSPPSTTGGAPSAARCRFGEVAAGPAQPSAGGVAHGLAIYYVVPSDVPENPDVATRIKVATADVLAWYQCASTGRTFELAFPETVRVYHATQARAYYAANGDWWGSLLPEMVTAGLPVWASETVCAIWVQGAGWYAGAAPGCGGECGTALLGVELFPEFNNAAFSGGPCPNGEGITAFPCTPEGAYAHELGHTVGLVHPEEVTETNAVAAHSVMQTHWNYPTFAPHVEMPWGLLTLERGTLWSNPFMKDSIELVQTHDCDVVNLPMRGALPTVSFSYEETNDPGIMHFINFSGGASGYYWTFGDGGRSDDESPLHGYSQTGTFEVTLRATEPSMMVVKYSLQVPVTSTATQVSVVRLLAERGRVQLEWRVSDAVSVEVWREEEGRAWLAVDAPTRLDDGRYAYEDRDVTPGKRYSYRLAVETAAGVQLLGEVSVRVPAETLAVEGVNPSRGSLRVWLSLPSEAPATLEVYDVTGRRISAQAVTGGAGSHRVSAGGDLPAGVYLIRMTQGAHSATARAAVIRP